MRRKTSILVVETQDGFVDETKRWSYKVTHVQPEYRWTFVSRAARNKQTSKANQHNIMKL